MFQGAPSPLGLSLINPSPVQIFAAALSFVLLWGRRRRKRKKVHVIQHQVDIFSDCPFLSYSILSIFSLIFNFNTFREKNRAKCISDKSIIRSGFYVCLIHCESCANCTYERENFSWEIFLPKKKIEEEIDLGGRTQEMK